MKARIGGQSVRYVVLTAFAFVVLIPLVSIILASLNPPDAQISGLSIPSEWSWTNFAAAWTQGHFSRFLGSSAIVAGIVVPLSVVLATLAGFSLALLRPPGAKRISLAFVLGLTLPIELVVVALYFNLQPLGLTNSLLGVALAESALFMPFGVYWMQTHFSGIPQELVESARIDGATDLVVLLRILVPISWPAITTLCVLLFMWSWNQFLLVLVLIQDPNKRTAPAGLGFFLGEHSTNIPLLSAASLIAVVPIVVVYLIFQRSFVSGITQGAVKG